MDRSDPSPEAAPAAPAVTTEFCRTCRRLCVLAVLPPPLPDDEQIMGAAQIARAFGLPEGALRKRLERWQRGNFEGWIEVQNRRRGQARYLYRVGSVRHLFAGLASDAGR